MRGNLLFGSCIVVIEFLSWIQCEPLKNGACESLNDTSCKKGIVLPLWKPVHGLSIGDKIARAFVYFVSLMYLFLGVSIIADRFMASIEVITSKERKVIVRKKNGEMQTINVRIWNETVSNLTLMALGSSAPEILLSVIEICGSNFEAGDLGPGTIVGSAAFNLFIIIGYCVYVIPDGEVRRIKHLSVFLITASWSVFAYIWLYLIIAFFSPEVIQVWEALLTFFFFFLTVLTAYVADTKIFIKKFLKRRYLRKNVKSYALEGDHELHCNHSLEDAHLDGDKKENLTELEKTRMDYIEVIREIRLKNPNIDPKTLEEQAQIEVLNRVPKSRAFYRMQATRTLTGSGNVIKKSKLERRLSQDPDKLGLKEKENNNQKIFFDPGHYTVMENVGTFNVMVKRTGTDEQIAKTMIEVEYCTEDGTATAGDDYIATSGVVLFQSGEDQKPIEISIIDDDIFEADEHFFINLKSPRAVTQDGKKVSINQLTEQNIYGVELIEPFIATIMVLDDDHAGIFNFEEAETVVAESCGEAEIKVCRSSGARGVVLVPYRSRSDTATGGTDYIEVESYLEFMNDQTEAFIKVNIIDDNEYEKDEYFHIELGEPILVKKPGIGKSNIPKEFTGFNHVSEVKTHSDQLVSQSSEIEDMGKPRLGDIKEIKVIIKESLEFKHVVDNLLRHGQLSEFIGTSSWKEQFVEAITVSPGENDTEDSDDLSEEKLPSCLDYVMHFLTLFWKVLFAFVPPTDYLGGWVSFWVCIVVIGALTAVIGDLASGFGCTIGMTNAVTAITFVAMGTSLPDTFASKVAAINDDSADSSVGNVTGSNAVNVFLGIGLAWSIAAVYHFFKGSTFRVKSGSLGFSVTVFCIFALTAIAFMLLRRNRRVGGELGGPRHLKIATTIYFVGLWIVYVILSSLENYCHIKGF
uniref:Slc8a-1 n=1 Tax=Schmidtea mediterranea TaxID=79327 RepID=A0A0H3YEY7_SCHMD|nr:slc8a-1 [Schmidtea mediterranea]